MKVAKILRDAPMHVDCKASIISRMHAFFKEDNPLMDSKKFLGIASGKTNDKDMENFFKQRQIKL